MTWNKVAVIVWAAASLGLGALQSPACAQDQNPILKEDAAEKLTDHVYMIRGFPNVVIVIGKTGTLVVDTGLGPKNGAVVARTVAKLGGPSKIFLTTTHFHPEHVAGEGGFPKGTVLIRARVQHEEMEQDNERTLNRFRARRTGDAGVIDRSLLEGVSYRKPDIIFDKHYDLDLGGVHARLMWAGRAHTQGDTVVFVREGKVLVTGDVIHNKYGPVFAAAGVTLREWIRTIDALAPLHPKLIVPTHSLPGGEAVLFAMRGFLQTLDDRARALKAAGTSVDEAAKILNAELQTRYPDWELHSLSSAVALVYTE